MPAVHPAWLHVNFLLGRFPRFDGGCGLKLLNNYDDVLIVESAAANETKAVERACKGILPVSPKSINAPGLAKRASRAKSKVGQGQGNAESKNETDYYGSRITRQHRILLAQIDCEGKQVSSPSGSAPRRCRITAQRTVPNAWISFPYLTFPTLFLTLSDTHHLNPSVWGRSSVGRALEWHSRGRRFDPDRLHQMFHINQSLGFS